MPLEDRPTKLEPGDTNAIGRMLGVLGDEWNLLIIQQAVMGAARYTEFMSRLPISNSVLSKRLRMLVGEGLLTPDYATTARSRSLWPVLVSIWQWERMWVTEHQELLPAMRHARCGHLFSPLMRCTSCGATVGDDGIELALGPSGQWSRFAPTATTRRRSESDATARQAGLFPQTMSVLGNRWAAALLVSAFLGTTRFTDFQAQLGIPPSLLTERLQTFGDIGVLSAVPADGSERAAYRLSGKGRALAGVLVTALQWAQRWFAAPDGAAVLVRHRDCGSLLGAELACDRCGERLCGAQVDVTSAEAAGIP
ncbi:MAG: helix-turn-helix domain-containing protein [Mycobacterium sp.]